MPLPVLFEDHTLIRMRPVSWSLPVYETRVGILNTRERVSLATGEQGGFLLSRSILADLHGCRDWLIGPEALIAHASAGRESYLWINARLAPRWDVVEFLTGLPGETPDFVWEGPDGVVAALLSAEASAKAAATWLDWEVSAQEAGAWRNPAREVPAWPAESLVPDGLSGQLDDGHTLVWSRDSGEDVLQDLTGGLDRLAAEGGALIPWIWDIVDWTGRAIVGDLARIPEGSAVSRTPFGLVPTPESGDPAWKLSGGWSETEPGVFREGGVEVHPSVAFDPSAGPIVLDKGVRVAAHCHLEGPLYLGAGTRVKSGTRIYGPSSFGIGNRLSGEIGETTTGDFVNKQHDGFIGHAVLGSWINLGAMTTCSDLKNNYGKIRVDLGGGALDTGRRFVGLLMGDHAKTAIGTLFNTGTCVGFGANVFGSGMPPKFVPGFSWGGEGKALTEIEKAMATAEVVLGRRGCLFGEAHERLFRALS